MAAALQLLDNLRARVRILRERVRPDPDRPVRIWARELWLPLSALGFAVGGVLLLDSWLLTCGYSGCPTAAEIRAFRPAEGGRILDRQGRLMGRLTNIRRINVPLEEVPVHVRHAFIATEDRRFYDHGGLDFRAVVRAFARNMMSLSVREGFSTISMQVARNAFGAQRYAPRSLRRKLMELRLARILERRLEKDDILELYLNVIYLGNGTYGVEAASRDLFGKGVKQLSIAEGAMLAALPKGPSAYTPRRNPARARARRNLVLELMVRDGFLSEDRARTESQRVLRVTDRPLEPERLDESYALDAVRAVVDSVLNALGRDVGDVTIHTTLDLDAQRAADRAIARRAAAISRESRSWYGRNRGEIQGALVALDPRTGDIRALVGGSRYQRGGFNRALAARRQPGSAFKPFVYAAAMSVGLSPATMVDDQPVEVSEGGRTWTPANYDHEYEGRVTLRRALMYSSNAATVRVSRAVGEQRVVKIARDNGITSTLSPVPSIALGALEVTPLELVTAYAPFANGGVRVRPRLIRRIETSDGTPVFTMDIERARVMDPRDAYLVTSMLRGAVDYGTGRSVRAMGVNGPLAGKTGTTNNNTDVWFVGYTPNLVAGVWFGYDRPQRISGRAAGGRLAAPAWAEFYREGWKDRATEQDWTPPAGMISRVIDAETGELAGPWCPVPRQEYFKPGTEPTSTCSWHGPSGWEWGDDSWSTAIGDRISRALRRVFGF